MVTLLSWLAAVCVTLVTALGLSLIGRSMSWFSRPHLLLPLYIGPALLAMASIHHCWQLKVSGSSLVGGALLGLSLLEGSCISPDAREGIILGDPGDVDSTSCSVHCTQSTLSVCMCAVGVAPSSLQTASVGGGPA